MNGKKTFLQQIYKTNILIKYLCMQYCWLRLHTFPYRSAQSGLLTEEKKNRLQQQRNILYANKVLCTQRRDYYSFLTTFKLYKKYAMHTKKPPFMIE